ncbi:hypothetical protein LTR53_014864 [Teratosphaeriaceae sp. CCFEE 6253]|nr:hypothetical protein LTR53_014864 [Teratosphaeriaceae sp. CCFEE 6253]
MATLPPMPPVRVSSLADDDSSPSSHDPFWQATPRLVPLPGPAPRAAMPPTVPKPPPSKQVRQTGQSSRRPQCTHMTMDRVHGNLTCYMCTKTPAIGWLYVCTQDRELDQSAPLHDPDSFLIVPNESSYYDVQARLTESLGIKACVVRGIRNRDYTFEQVDKLLEQKRHLLAIISRQENPSSDSPQPQGVRTWVNAAADSIIATVGAAPGLPVQAAADQAHITQSSAVDGGTSGALKTTKVQKQSCSFQVCHACRPIFRDRLYMSFDTMLSGRLPTISEHDIRKLRMLDPAIVSTWGLRSPPVLPLPSPPPSGSFDRSMNQGDGYDEDGSDWTPTSATITESDSDGQDDGDLYPCPGAGLCPLWDSHHGCAYDAGFDDGLRALNHGFGPDPDLSRITPEHSLNRLRRLRGSVSDTPGGSTSTASSISLPTPGFAPLTPITPVSQSFEEALTMRLSRLGKAATISGSLLARQQHSGGYGLGLHGKDSSSSLGSEVEVLGGVALTEEAVETGVPDIRTDDEQS